MCIWEKFPRPGARLYFLEEGKTQNSPCRRGCAEGLSETVWRENKPLRSIGIRNG